MSNKQRIIYSDRLTVEDCIIMDRWAYDPRYMGCGTASNAETKRHIGDMQNSTGVVGCVKNRINLVHENGSELVIEPMRHDDPFFSPSRIAIY